MTDSQQSPINVRSLYKTNSPYDGQHLFAEYLNTTLGTKSRLPDMWEERAKELDALIAQSPMTTSIRLFRAMCDEHISTHVTGDNLTYPAYMSTSTDEHSVQRHFACLKPNSVAALIYIECDVGTFALDMEPRGYSSMEEELLLARGSKFEILGIESVTDPAHISRLVGHIYSKNCHTVNLYELRAIAP